MPPARASPRKGDSSRGPNIFLIRPDMPNIKTVLLALFTTKCIFFIIPLNSALKVYPRVMLVPSGRDILGTWMGKRDVFSPVHPKWKITRLGSFSLPP